MEEAARIELGVRLGVRRVARGIDQCDVARMAGCHPSTVSRIEDGSYRGGEGTILAVGAALGLDRRGLDLELEEVRYRLSVDAARAGVARRNPNHAASMVMLLGDMVLDGEEQRKIILTLLAIRRARATAPPVPPAAA